MVTLTRCEAANRPLLERVVLQTSEPAEATCHRPGPPTRERHTGRGACVNSGLSHPNIRIKISGVCTLSHELYPYNDIWDPVLKVIDALGIDRCMWGTDWTRATELLTYEQGVESFRVTKRLSDSDRSKLMGGTLEKVYKWHR
ncbi:MAG: amidohydrolase family protein [Acetobacteraceae bacterium]